MKETNWTPIRKRTRRIAGILKVALIVAGVVGASSPPMAVKATEAPGTAASETSQQAGQRGNSAWVCGGEGHRMS